jgi:hypothetical protein
MHNDLKTVWAKITRCLQSALCEIQTVRLNGSPGIWFSAEMKGDGIRINNARMHRPSSNLTQSRYISEAEFMQFAAYYDGWCNGQYQRSDIRKFGKNTSYIFALINHFTKVTDTI